LALGEKVSDVTVLVQDGGLSPNSQASIDTNEAEIRLKGAILAGLSEWELYDPAGALSLEVEIQQFTMRSGAKVLFSALLFTKDRLDCSVKIKKRGLVVADFYLPASGSGGLWNLKIGQESRSDSLFRKLGRGIAARVFKSNLSKADADGDVPLVGSPSGSASNGRDVSLPISPSEDGNNCSTQQVLSMSKLGLSEAQISNACAK